VVDAVAVPYFFTEFQASADVVSCAVGRHLVPRVAIWCAIVCDGFDRECEVADAAAIVI
jgi:hypothetical protein